MCDENIAEKKPEDDETVEELKRFLPKWVTQEQVTDMIRGTCRNIVEIVDDFYEHETLFYEQVSVCSGSQEDEFVSKLEFIDCETESSSQFHKLKGLSSVSPAKTTRKRKIKGKQKKKGKVEPAGPKQASITKFFNKVPSNETNA